MKNEVKYGALSNGKYVTVYYRTDEGGTNHIVSVFVEDYQVDYLKMSSVEREEIDQLLTK